MLRVVLDTSSLVSYVLTQGDIMRRVIAHWRANRMVVLSSPQTRAELAAVLDRPQIRRRASSSLNELVQGVERYTWPFEIEGATVCLLDENLDTLEVVTTNEDGEYQFSKTYKQHNYRIAASMDEYNTAQKDVSTYGKLPYAKIRADLFLEMDFNMLEEENQLEPLSIEVVGGNEIQILQIEHINYAFASDEILPEAAETLDQVIFLVMQYPDLEVKIESHTDSKGSDAYNLKLSQRRAASANKYLIAHGINADIIEATGYGETQLLNHCEDGVECNEQEHSINRRSIIKVIRRGEYKTKRNTRSIFYF